MPHLDVRVPEEFAIGRDWKLVDVATGKVIEHVLAVDTDRGWAIVSDVVNGNCRRVTGKFELVRVRDGKRWQEVY